MPHSAAERNKRHAVAQKKQRDKVKAIPRLTSDLATLRVHLQAITNDPLAGSSQRVAPVRAVVPGGGADSRERNRLVRRARERHEKALLTWLYEEVEFLKLAIVKQSQAFASLPFDGALFAPAMDHLDLSVFDETGC